MTLSTDLNRDVLRLLNTAGKAYILMNESNKLIASSIVEERCTIHRIIEIDNAEILKERVNG